MDAARQLEANEPLQGGVLSSDSDDDDDDECTVFTPVPLSPRTTRSRMQKQKKSRCLTLQRLISGTPFLNYFLSAAVLLLILGVIYLCRDYAKMLLFWIEHQNPWLIFFAFMLLFVIVSFPVAVGYLVLMITSGYLFGCLKGFATVVVGANLGVTVAHNTIRCIQNKLPVHRLIKNDTGRAILRVISGPRAFKIVLFTRLTPLPFGLQNTIFGISSVDAKSYHLGTLLGLLPAQAINVYLGSTLRSMHDVLNDHKTAITGYIIFAVQLLILFDLYSSNAASKTTRTKSTSSFVMHIGGLTRSV
ncbi:transmembrane protein 64 isoform X2 [Hermetia illucens]|uniref:transmembrane protein 64 isoform X2 n=1 Tax=Hermetia illucens TaxID=343691 RepID=UPI0018CC2BC3|nr:transmembrane protein 64 isoform X2 [Hermetia illucens]